MRLLLSLAIAILVLLGPAGSAQAMDRYQVARFAYEAGRFDEARSLLADTALREDPDALLLLGQMTRDGQGGPRDLVEAYKLFSLVFMIGAPDPRADAAEMRREVARDLTWAQILEGEQQVIRWVDEGLAPGGREDMVARLLDLLEGCDPVEYGCEFAIEQVYRLGPAAAPLIGPVARLMTEDPHWMPRESYAAALAMIGTAAVPAMCRILLDKVEIASEGSWNIEEMTFYLGTMGPTAARARGCLIGALARDYVKLGLGESETPQYDDEPLEDIITRLKFQFLMALVTIGDPDRESHDSLAFYFQYESDKALQLATGWAMGMLYGEFGLAMSRLPWALDSTDPAERGLGLGILLDLIEQPGFVEAAAPLVPRLRAIALGEDEELAQMAAEALMELEASSGTAP